MDLLELGEQASRLRHETRVIDELAGCVSRDMRRERIPGSLAYDRATPEREAKLQTDITDALGREAIFFQENEADLRDLALQMDTDGIPVDSPES